MLAHIVQALFQFLFEGHFVGDKLVGRRSHYAGFSVALTNIPRTPSRSWSCRQLRRFCQNLFCLEFWKLRFHEWNIVRKRGDIYIFNRYET